MSERYRQTEFLKKLIQFSDTEPARHLQERLHQAQQDENNLRRKICGVIFLFFLALVGFGYTAIFVPEAYNVSFHWLVRIFSVLALAAVLCLGIFVPYWCSYRRLVNRIQEEARGLVHSTLGTARGEEGAASREASRTEQVAA